LGIGHSPRAPICHISGNFRGNTGRSHRRQTPRSTLDLEKDPIAAHIPLIEFRPKALACAQGFSRDAQTSFFLNIDDL
jgi:hypothetical protein